MFEEFSAVEDSFHRSTSIHHLPFGLPTTFHGGSSSSSPSSSSSLAAFDQHGVLWQREEERLGNGIRPWSQEELLCMMKIRSCFDNWFPPYFMWDHVSRKLHEEGFHRSALECKCKFEEGENNEYSHEFKVFIQEEEQNEQIQKVGLDDNLKEDGMVVAAGGEGDERGEGEKFEMLKGMCEKVVRTLMAKQEEMQERMMEDMQRRDAEKTQREEAFMKHEMDKVEMEMEMREKERILTDDRNSAIIKLLKKFEVSSISSITDDLLNLFQSPPSSRPPKESIFVETHALSVGEEAENAGGWRRRKGKEENGRRWRREEVVALINLRCGSIRRRGEGCSKGEPLWEKVSRKMTEMGYRRSSKRCKEKWENINKYFRKTREEGRKRTVGSRTCPYFHHLTALYGGVGGGGGGGPPMVVSSSTENLLTPPSVEEACKLQMNERCMGGGSLCSCCWCVEEEEEEEREKEGESVMILPQALMY